MKKYSGICRIAFKQRNAVIPADQLPRNGRVLHHRRRQQTGIGICCRSNQLDCPQDNRAQNQTAYQSECAAEQRIARVNDRQAGEDVKHGCRPVNENEQNDKRNEENHHIGERFADTQRNGAEHGVARILRRLQHL